MQLASVNVGVERPIKNAKPSGRTGIYKQPTAAPVMVTPLGLEGDVIIDTENHGGPDQAIYFCTTPDYEWWSAHIGRALGPGTFGDNLTITWLDSASLNIGDRLQVGPVQLEITAPRIPCVTIATRMEDPQFIKKFRTAERPGAYCRVIETGPVRAGDPVQLLPYQGERVTIADFFRWYYEKPMPVDHMRRLLAVPIPEKARLHYQQKLAEQTSPAGG